MGGEYNPTSTGKVLESTIRNSFTFGWRRASPKLINYRKRISIWLVEYCSCFSHLDGKGRFSSSYSIPGTESCFDSADGVQQGICAWGIWAYLGHNRANAHCFQKRCLTSRVCTCIAIFQSGTWYSERLSELFFGYLILKWCQELVPPFELCFSP